VKARVGEGGGTWEVECPKCGAWQTLDDGEHTFDCEATEGCEGELHDPPFDVDDYDDGDEVIY